MADDIQINVTGTAGDTFGSDDISGVKYTRVKIRLAADGVAGRDIERTEPACCEPVFPNSVPTRMKFSTGGTGDSVIITGVADQTIRIVSIDASTTGTGDIFFKSGSTAIFADGTNPIPMQVEAGAGVQRFNLAFNPDGWFQTAPGEDLIVNQASPVPITGSLAYETIFDLIPESIVTGESVPGPSIGHSFAQNSITSGESVPTPTLETTIGTSEISVASIPSAESVSSPSSSSVLVPGTGWVGVTPQPAPVGNIGDAHYSMTPASRWHVVPGQTINGSIEIGVIAYHNNGIERVEMSVNNGPWLEILETTYNSTSNNWEYNAILDASLFSSDGEVEVRARIYPLTAGQVRVLGATPDASNNFKGFSALRLFVNPLGGLPTNAKYVSSSGSDSNDGDTPGTAYATTSKAINVMRLDPSTYDGGEILITTAGTYPAPAATSTWVNSRWITVRPNTGVDPSTVTITPAGAGTIDRIKFYNCKWLFSAEVFQYGSTRNVWLDEMDISSEVVQNVSGQPFKDMAGSYITNCYWHDMFNGAIGIHLCSNTNFENMVADILKRTRCAVNITSHFFRDLGSFHGDGTQYFLFEENVILLNYLQMDNDSVQPFYADRGADYIKDSAFVNVCAIHQGMFVNPPHGQVNLTLDGVLFAHFTFDSVNMYLQDYFVGGHPANPNAPGPSTFANVRVVNCVWRNFGASVGDPPWPHMQITHNHFTQGGTQGTDVTIGDVTSNFTDPPFGYAISLSGAAAALLQNSGTRVPGLKTDVPTGQNPHKGYWDHTTTVG